MKISLPTVDQAPHRSQIDPDDQVSGMVGFTVSGVFYAPFEQAYDARQEGEYNWRSRVFFAPRAPREDE